MMSFIQKYLDIPVILILLIFTVLPLFQPGFFPMHDNEQIGRLYELNKDVITGQLPPRLAQDLGFGFDYPLFNFYPSFVYYIGEIFHLFGFSLITSTKLMIGCGFIFAAVFMYLFAKQYVGRIGGVVAAIAYSYTPYHSVDVYVRGALPEFWSFVFIPAVFWSIYKLSKTDEKKYIVLSGIFAGCLILSHDLMAMMSSFFLGPYFLYLIFQSKKKWQLCGKIFLSMALGLCFTAYFWIPSYFEKQYTMVQLLTVQSADYHQHYVCIKNFLNSPWGYGGSIPDCESGLSFQIGQSQLAFAVISALVSIYFVWKKRKNYGVAILFIVMFIFSLFIQTKYSFFIWDKIQPFAYIQFPWRFLTFSDFLISFLGVYMFSFIKKDKIKIIAAALMVVILILTNKFFFVPKTYLKDVTDVSYTASSVIRWTTSLMSFEYTPHGISTHISSSGDSAVDIAKSEIPTKSYSVISGKMAVTQLQDIPQEKNLLVTVSKPGLLMLNTFTFPGWKIFVDNNKVSYSANNKLKLITIALSKGKHTVRAEFTNTLIRSVADWISALSILIAIIFTFTIRKDKKMLKNHQLKNRSLV